MAKITIDTNIWVTPAQLCREKNLYNKWGVENVQKIWQWMQRNKVEYWRIEELGIVLIKRSTVPL